MRRFLPCLLMLSAIFNTQAKQLSLEDVFGPTNLTGNAPRNLQISPDGRHVAYLQSSASDRQRLDLWEYDIEDGKRHVLIDSRTLKATGELSDAEKARLERQRTAGLSGILDYQWSPDSHKILVPAAGSLYVYDLASPGKPTLVTDGDPIDPKISPRGQYVSYVRQQNLYVFDLKTGATRQLTRDGGGTFHNAEAEFVAQEEMAQSSGYWWAPDDSRIAYKQFDEANVPVAKRIEIYADRADLVQQRYPGAGQANVQVTLHVVSVADAKDIKVDLGNDTDIYLVRADWSPDAGKLLFTRQSRDQKSLDLIMWTVSDQHQLPLVHETSKTWVSILQPPRFLTGDKGFLWVSERTGYRHVYQYDYQGRLKANVTQGEWGIDELLAVDEEEGKLYFSSNREDATEHQLYALPIAENSHVKPTRISREAGWHDFRFARTSGRYVDIWSDPDTPPSVSLRDRQGKLITWIEHNALDDKHPYHAFVDAHVKTEFGNLQAADGQVLHYSIKRPHDAIAGQRHPVLVEVYGGPGAQTVQKRWGSLFDQYLVQHGYVVFRLDNRGSAHRERRFTDVIYRELGKYEVADQLLGIDWLARQDFVDPKRVAVFGWSYGGFMTLRLLEAGSDKIAAGISVAPVTDWSLYDTHYTEQFLSTPADNPDGYKSSSVFSHLDGLKSPLLLMHGMADDNVLFTNSTRLIDALVGRGLSFQLMTYPGAKHGISGMRNQLHVYHTLENFLNQALPAQSGADHTLR